MRHVNGIFPCICVHASQSVSLVEIISNFRHNFNKKCQIPKRKVYGNEKSAKNFPEKEKIP